MTLKNAAYSLASALALTLLCSASLAAPKLKYACDVSEGVVYEISGGTKTALAEVELFPLGDQFDTRGYFAKVTLPEAPKAAVVLFSGSGDFITAVDVHADTLMRTGVLLSPGGTRLLISKIKGDYAAWEAFSFPAMKRLASTPQGIIWDMGPFWLDENRFVCNFYDETQVKPGLSAPETAKGYCQVNIFDIKTRKFTPLQKHSLTDEYYATGARGGIITMTRYFVKDAAHWAASSEAYEGPEEVFSELTYRWDPQWKPSENWEEPKDIFMLDTDETPSVIRVSGSAREKMNIKVHTAGAYSWFTADKAQNPELQDKQPAVYIFNDFGMLVARVPAEPETWVQNVSFSPEEKVFLVDSRYLGDTAEHVLELYRNDAGIEHIQTLRLAVGDFFWLDPWRVAYSRMNIELERKGGGEIGYAVDAVVYDSAVDLFETLRSGDACTDFRVKDISENGDILIEEDTVDNPAEWGIPEKHRKTVITSEPPAAG